MNFFTRYGRAMLITAVLAVGAVCLSGCVTGTEPEGGGGNNCGTDGTDGSCKTAVIGGQTWMAENLNYQTGNSWCYNDSNSYCRKYGRLYDWETAKTACQSVGMRLPTREEWGALAKAAGGTGDYGAGGTAGVKLKSKSGWYGNGNGTNDYGFSALPSGTRYTGGRFLNAGYYGNWWTATESSDGNAYYRGMGYDIGSGGVGEGYDGDRGYGFSVRCVR
jgi:uncharacterized protein (TIGR02145 family)